MDESVNENAAEMAATTEDVELSFDPFSYQRQATETIERDGVRLEVAFLARDENGSIYTPLRSGRGEWPPETFGSDIVELLGASVHVIRLSALIADKMVLRDDPSVTAKDQADLVSLDSLPHKR